MKNGQAEIIELFPTPVMKRKYEGDLTDTVKFLDSCKMVGDFPQAYGTNSQDVYILENKQCYSLKTFILESVTTFATQILSYDYKEYNISLSWISYKEPGQHHTAHTHPNSLISGVFYYGEYEDNTPAITFHKATGGINVPYLYAKPNLDSKVDKTYSTELFNFPIESNTLLLFSSHLLHSVPPNETNKVRKSLAFNVLSKGRIGDSGNLTEVLFHKMV